MDTPHFTVASMEEANRWKSPYNIQWRHRGWV